MKMTKGHMSEIGWMLMIGGAICILVWLLLKFLWAIGLALIVAGLVLYLAGKTPSKRK